MAASTSNRASAISAVLDRGPDSAVDDSEANEKDDVDGVGDECSIISLLEDDSDASSSLLASASPKSLSRTSAGELLTSITEELDRKQGKRLHRWISGDGKKHPQKMRFACKASSNCTITL